MQSMPAWGMPAWGMPRPVNVLKIRPSKGKSESVFSSFLAENNGILVYQNTYFSVKSRMIAICMSHIYMIIFSFVAIKHLDIASYIP